MCFRLNDYCVGLGYVIIVAALDIGNMPALQLARAGSTAETYGRDNKGCSVNLNSSQFNSVFWQRTFRPFAKKLN